MLKIPNSQEISSIHFERTISPYCPMGADYYKAEIDVDFEGPYYMDYIEMDKEIQAMGGAVLTIEELAKKVYDLMMQFEPEYLEVTIYAESNKHFPVIVTKEYENYI